MSAQWVREGRKAAADAEGGEEPAARLRLATPLGQGEVLQRWVQLARRHTLPHGFLVDGPRGSGKTTVVRYLAAALLCPSDLDTEAPCGVCRTCTRIANGLHPDVHLLERAQSEQDKKTWGKLKSFYVITVDQVRAGQDALARHAVEGKARVLVIDDADCLDEEGQNALLKTLEEPGRSTFLLLEASRPEQLLPTVRSRLQRLRVRPLDETTLRRELSRREPETSMHHELAVQLAQGSLGAAMLVCTERVVQLHDLVQAMLRAPDRLRPVATARAALAGTAERWQELEAARTFLWVLRAVLVQQGLHLAADGDSTYGAARTEPWTTWLERTLAAERDLDLLIPAEQVLTACLVSFVAG